MGGVKLKDGGKEVAAVYLSAEHTRQQTCKKRVDSSRKAVLPVE